jgi:uncharacterized protein YndB with AHSA1/START domain
MTRTQIHIDSSPESVFAVLADGERYAEWVVGAKAIRRADPDFPGPGAQLHHTVGALSLVVRDTTRVVDADPPRLLELEARANGLRAIVRFRLLQDPTGTTVVMDEEGATPLSRALSRGARPLVAARNAETLWRLRTEVAAGADRLGASGASVDGRSPVPRPLGDATARLFGLVAALRGQRALHPRGVTRLGTAHLTGRGAGLSEQPDPTVIVRFSRGAGLPSPMPDVNCLAIRFVDACGPSRHRDLLYAGAGPGVLRHVLVPGVDFGTARFSSLLRYRLQDDAVVLTARVDGAGLSLDRLANDYPVRVHLFAEGGGRAEPIGDIDLGEVVDGSEVRFDPVSAEAGLVPLGLLNALRGPAYAASQAARTDGALTAR